MRVTLEHSEKTPEGTDGLTKRARKKSRDLMQVGEVVGGPGREQFAERDGIQDRVATAAFEIGRLQCQFAQSAKGFRARRGELVEQVEQRRVFAGTDVGESIECGEVARFAVFEDDAGTGNPVGAFSVDEVGDDLAGSHGIWSLVLLGKGGRQSAQERVECGGSASQKCGNFADWECHRISFCGS